MAADPKDLFAVLREKGFAILERSAGRVIGQIGANLVALSKDGRVERWRLRLPSKKEGYTYADAQTILWNQRGERRVVIAVSVTDGRRLWVLKRERAMMLDGDRCLTMNDDGTGSLRRTESGEVVATLPGLSGIGPYSFIAGRRWLVAGQPFQVWNLEEASLRLSVDLGLINGFEFTPDSDRIIVTTIMTPQSGMEEEITKRTYDVRTGALVEERSWWGRQG